MFCHTLKNLRSNQPQWLTDHVGLGRDSGAMWCGGMRGGRGVYPDMQSICSSTDMQPVFDLPPGLS